MISKIRNLFKNKDHGFSLLEVSVAVGIMVIGFTIAIPTFDNALEAASANEVKSNLSTTSITLENARLTNEGVYPTSFTDEMLANNTFKSVRYTYSDDQQNYCLMGVTDSNQKLFLSSEGLPSGVPEEQHWGDVYKPSLDAPGCTLPNVGYDGGLGGSTRPLISSPSIVSANNSWDFANGAASSEANLSWSQGTCVSDPSSTYVVDIQGTQYQARWVNVTNSSIIQYNGGNWSSSSNITGAPLTDWLPNDNFTHQVRMRCIADFEVYYTDWVVSSQDTVDTFDVYKTYVLSSPTPTVTWDYGTTSPKGSFTVAEITCPSGFSPIYRGHASQAGATSITTDWQSSANFLFNLTNFTSGKAVSFTADSACSLNANTYVIGTLNPPLQEGNASPVMTPPQAPSPVANLHCEVAQLRGTSLDGYAKEAALGGCDENATSVMQTYAPNAIRWDASQCASGYSPTYFTSKWNGLDWDSAVSQTSPIKLLTNNPIPGSIVKYKVYAKCSDGSEGGTSVAGGSTEITFTTSWQTPTNAAFEMTWTPSTDDSSWASAEPAGATLAGSATYMYDRVTASTTSTCSNDSAPIGYVYRLQRQSDGSVIVNGTLSDPVAGLTINRSQWSASAQYWAEGNSIKLAVAAVCSDPSGDYEPVLSEYSAYSPEILIGYESPNANIPNTTMINCVTKYSRLATAEATKGGCITDATVSTNNFAPDVIRATAVTTCLSGYSPTYFASEDDGATWASLGTGRDYTPSNHTAAGESHTVQMKHQCVSSTRKSDYSSEISKTYVTSLKANQTGTLDVAFTASVADTSWANASALNGYYLYDQFDGSTTVTCTNGEYPNKFNASVSKAVVAGVNTAYAWNNITLDNDTTPNVKRSDFASASTIWMEGSKMSVKAQAVCEDPNGDYNEVAMTAPTAVTTFSIAAQAPATWTVPVSSGTTFSYAPAGNNTCTAVYGGYNQYDPWQNSYGNTASGYNTGTWRDTLGWRTAVSVSVKNAGFLVYDGRPVGMSVTSRCVSSYGIIGASTATVASNPVRWELPEVAPTSGWAGVISYRTAGWGASCTAGNYPLYYWYINNTLGQTWASGGYTQATSWDGTAYSWGNGTVNMQAYCNSYWGTSAVKTGARGGFGTQAGNDAGF